MFLEPQAAEFAAATADPLYLFDLGPVDGRKAGAAQAAIDQATTTLRQAFGSPAA